MRVNQISINTLYGLSQNLLHIVNYVKQGRYKGGVCTPLIRGKDSHSQLCERGFLICY